MKKIINDPHDVVPEMVDGMTRSYPQYIEKLKELKLLFAQIKHQ